MTATVTNLGVEALKAELEKLRAENKALSERKPGNISFRVSQSGACSVYGLQRWPVTLYKEQWARLMEKAGELQGFLKAHDSELKAKGEAVRVIAKVG
jgi:hypothetical protein